MKRSGLLAVIAVMFMAAMLAQSRQPAGTTHTGKAFRFNKVKEGIYHAVGTGSLAVVGNSSVIVNDNDVIVVDDHVSPAAAWVLLEEIKDAHQQAGAPRSSTRTSTSTTPTATRSSSRTCRSSATSSRARCCSATRSACRSTRATSTACQGRSRR